jgi:hypothetical protein
MNTMTNPEYEAPNDTFPSKDEFFKQLAQVADEMIRAYGADFTMGTLILAARFIAEGRPLQNDEEAATTPVR